MSEHKIGLNIEPEIINQLFFLFPSLLEKSGLLEQNHYGDYDYREPRTNDYHTIRF